MRQSKIDRVKAEMRRLMADGEWWYVLDLAEKGNWGRLDRITGTAGGMYIAIAQMEKEGTLERRVEDGPYPRRSKYRLIGGTK